MQGARSNPRAAPVLAVVGVGAALAYLAGVAPDRFLVRLALKAIPVLALAAWVRLRSSSPFGWLIAFGLVASAAGDVLLEGGAFLPGLSAFLLAHLVYIAAFVVAERRWALVRLVPFAAWALVVFGYLRPRLGPLMLPVAAYVAAITAMMWRASARVFSLSGARASGFLGLAGALAFGASDTLLAIDRFAEPVPGARFWIMLLYWLGQWAIAASAPGHFSRGAPPAPE